MAAASPGSRSQDEDLIDVAMEQTGGKMWEELMKIIEQLGISRDFKGFHGISWDFTVEVSKNI